MVSESYRVHDVFNLNTNSSHQCLCSAAGARPIFCICKAPAVPGSVFVYASYSLSHCMQPEGLWQRLAAALTGSAPIFPPLST